jgi:hypothetical protein
MNRRQTLYVAMFCPPARLTVAPSIVKAANMLGCRAGLIDAGRVTASAS